MSLVALPGIALGSGEAVPMHMQVNYSKEALRDGARTFANNCMGCHSAKYYRFKNLVKDLGMTKSGVEDGLMFGSVSINEHMSSAMPAEQASKWFGKAPPDLSLETRVRGTNWVYSYLLAFYRDGSSASGWNNHVFPKVSMPNVLYHMTPGAPEYYDSVAVSHGEEHGEVDYPEVPQELDAKVQNLVSFMTYMGDPSILDRKSMGPWVLLFLVVLGVLTYLVKKEYWRDIH